MAVLVGEREVLSAIPPRTLSECGLWLCERHSDLAALVQRLGLWDDDLNAPDMREIREVIVRTDTLEGLRVMCSQRQRAAMREVERLSPGDRARMRLLATLVDRPAFGHAPEFAASDLVLLATSGRDLVVDYLRALRVAVIG